MDRGDGEAPLTARLSAVEPFYPVTLAEEEEIQSSSRWFPQSS